MTTFDDREKAFENKFAHDAQLRFEAKARRNRSLGLWAADLLGYAGDAAEAYAQTIIMADLKHPDDGDVLEKLNKDLGDRITAAALEAKMADFMQEALEELPPPPS